MLGSMPALSRCAWRAVRSRRSCLWAFSLEARREAEPLEACAHLVQALPTGELGTATGRALPLFMELPSFADLTPRAYRLKAGNAAPPISTATGTSPCSPQMFVTDLPAAGDNLACPEGWLANSLRGRAGKFIEPVGK